MARTLTDLLNDQSFRVADHTGRQGMVNQWFATDLDELLPEGVTPEQRRTVVQQIQDEFVKLSPEPESEVRDYFRDVQIGAGQAARSIGTLGRMVAQVPNPFTAIRDTLAPEINQGIQQIEDQAFRTFDQAVTGFVDEIQEEMSPARKEALWRQNIALQGQPEEPGLIAQGVRAISDLSMDLAGNALPDDVRTQVNTTLDEQLGDFDQQVDFFIDNPSMLAAEGLKQLPNIAVSIASGGAAVNVARGAGALRSGQALAGTAAGTVSEAAMAGAEAYQSAYDRLYENYIKAGVPEAIARSTAEAEASDPAGIAVGVAGGALSGLGIPRAAAKQFAGIGSDLGDVAGSVAVSAFAEGAGEAVTQVGGNLNVIGRIGGVDAFEGTGQAAATGSILGGAITGGVEGLGSLSRVISPPEPEVIPPPFVPELAPIPDGSEVIVVGTPDGEVEVKLPNEMDDEPTDVDIGDMIGTLNTFPEEGEIDVGEIDDVDPDPEDIMSDNVLPDFNQSDIVYDNANEPWEIDFIDDETGNVVLINEAGNSRTVTPEDLIDGYQPEQWIEEAKTPEIEIPTIPTIPTPEATVPQQPTIQGPTIQGPTLQQPEIIPEVDQGGTDSTGGALPDAGTAAPENVTGDDAPTGLATGAENSSEPLNPVQRDQEEPGADKPEAPPTGGENETTAGTGSDTTPGTNTLIPSRNPSEPGDRSVQPESGEGQVSTGSTEPTFNLSEGLRPDVTEGKPLINTAMNEVNTSYWTGDPVELVGHLEQAKTWDEFFTRWKEATDGKAIETPIMLNAAINSGLIAKPENSMIANAIYGKYGLVEDSYIFPKNVQRLSGRSRYYQRGGALTHFRKGPSMGSYIEVADPFNGAEVIRYLRDNPDKKRKEFPADLTEVLLHESLHQVLLEQNVLDGTGEYDSELRRIGNVVLNHYNNLTEDQRNEIPIAKAYYSRQNNAFQNYNEIHAWGITNPKMQEYLKTIPDPDGTKPNMWSRFVEKVREFLGLPDSPEVSSALDSLLTAFDNVPTVNSTPMMSPRKEVKDNESVRLQEASPEQTSPGPDRTTGQEPATDKFKAAQTRPQSGTVTASYGPVNATQKLGNRPTADALIDFAISESKKLKHLNWYGDVLESIRPYVTDIRIDFLDIPEKNIGGKYFPRGQNIHYDNTIGQNLHVIAHELVHAATIQALEVVQTERTARIRKELQSHYDHLRDVHALHGARGTNPLDLYGLSNLGEFVAEIYTNPAFRNYMDSYLIDQDKTLWDKVYTGILNGLGIKRQFNTENAVELTQILFDTNNDLRANYHQPFGATPDHKTLDDWWDKMRGFRPEQPPWSQRMRDRMGLKNVLRFRNTFVDTATPFLSYLMFDAKLRDPDRQYDDMPIWRKFKTIGGRTSAWLATWERDHLRQIKALNDTMTRKYKNKSSLSKHQISEAFAKYAQLSHVQSATAAARTQFLKAHHDTDKDYQDARRAGAQPDILQQYKDLADEARADLEKFDRIQKTNIMNPNEDSRFIRGGVTARQSLLAMDRMVTEFGLDRNDLERVRWAYVAANRHITDQLLAAGEFSQDQFDSWEALGLTKDYIPQSGRKDREDISPNPFDNSGNYAFGGYSLNPAENFKTQGRVSDPDNALETLYHRAVNAGMAINSQDFRNTLWAYAKTKRPNGGSLLPGVKTANSRQAEFLNIPKEARKIKIHNPNGGDNILWFDKDHEGVMTAIMGVEEELVGDIWRMWSKPTRAVSSLLTRFTMVFHPVNAVRDTWERLGTLVLRDIRKENGDKINAAAFTMAMGAYASSPRMFSSTLKLIHGRNKEQPVKPHKNDYWGNMLVELEDAGGLTTILSEYTLTEIETLEKIAGFNNITHPKGLLDQLKNMGYSSAEALSFVSKYLNTWAQIWEVRSSLAAYAALRDQGVTPETAAFRIRDAMNFMQRGRITPFLATIFPFANSIFQGAGNLTRNVRNLPTKRGLATMMGYYMASMGTLMLSMMFAGEDEDGENLVNLTNDATLQGNIPIYINDQNFLKLPVGYGIQRLAHSLAVGTLRKQTSRYADDVDLFGMAMSSVVKELGPLQSEVSFSEDPAGWIYAATTPFLLKPSIMSWANKDAWGNPIDYMIRRDRPDHVQGQFATDEAYKELAGEMKLALGVDVSPQMLEAHVKGYAIGPLSGVAEYFAGDEPIAGTIKGREPTARESLGFWEVLGVSRLTGKTVSPEVGLTYKHQNKVYKRMKETYTTNAKGQYEFKVPKGATPEERKTIEDDEKLFDDAVALDKAMTKIRKARNKLYKSALQKAMDTDPNGGTFSLNEPLFRQTIEPGLVDSHQQQLKLFRAYIDKVYPK